MTRTSNRISSGEIPIMAEIELEMEKVRLECSASTTVNNGLTELAEVLTKSKARSIMKTIHAPEFENAKLATVAEYLDVFEGVMPLEVAFACHKKSKAFERTKKKEKIDRQKTRLFPEPTDFSLRSMSIA